MFPVAGPRAAAKGRATAEAIVKRVRGIFKMMKLPDFSQLNIQAIGAEDTYGAHARRADEAREVAVWLAAQHENKKALQILSMEMASAGTGMAPGLTGLVGGRPKVSPTLKLFSFLHPKPEVDIEIQMGDEKHKYTPDSSAESTSDGDAEASSNESNADLQSGNFTFRLEDLAHTRSGDKGNNCNIGVIARHPSFLPYLRAALSPEAVGEYMQHVFADNQYADKVVRYEVPGVHGFNFVLKDSLGGGGIASVRVDPQGKAYGQMLLDFEIKDVPNLPEMAK